MIWTPEQQREAQKVLDDIQTRFHKAYCDALPANKWKDVAILHLNIVYQHVKAVRAETISEMAEDFREAVREAIEKPEDPVRSDLMCQIDNVADNLLGEQR